MNIEGPIFAIVTPFDKNGDIDYGALQTYLSFLNKTGVKNIIVNGTTGEFPSLTLVERMSLIEFCRSNFQGKVINNVSSCSIRECKGLISHSSEYSDYLLILPPFYYAGVSDEGVMEFFNEVLADSPNPVLLYNFPKHTQVHIKPEILKQLKREYRNLVGLKDSGGDLDISRSFKDAEGSLNVYIGSDTFAFEALHLGFDGSVIGGGNAIPEFPITIYNSFIRGDSDSAKRTQESFNIFNSYRKTLKLDGILTTKIALSTRIEGFPIDVRPPLMASSSTEIEEVANFMKEKVLPLLGDLS